MSVKYLTYVNLTSSSEKQPNEITPSPPSRNKSLSPPQAPSKSILAKAHTTPHHHHQVSLQFQLTLHPHLNYVCYSDKTRTSITSSTINVIPNNPHVSAMDNLPPGPSNPSPPPRVLRPPTGFLNLPLGFKLLLSTQPLFVNINNNTPHLLNNAPPLKNIYHPPPNLGNQDFPNPPNTLDFVHLNDIPHLHNMFCQYCSTTMHEI
nr:hypothetical protein [Tanacetum cinerariifolium]